MSPQPSPSEGKWFTLFRDNFDKLLLLALIGMFTAMHLFRSAVDPTTMSWGRDQITLVIGTFLGLVGGQTIRAMTAKKEPPETPAIPPLQTPPEKV